VGTWSERLNLFWQWNRPETRGLPGRFCVGSEQTNREIPSHRTADIAVDRNRRSGSFCDSRDDCVSAARVIDDERSLFWSPCYAMDAPIALLEAPVTTVQPAHEVLSRADLRSG
jgi:hypothetical protein